MASQRCRPSSTLAIVLTLSACTPSQAQGRDEADDFIHRSFGDAPYLRAEADLDGDGAPEIFAYVTDPRMCGSSGCNLLVLSPDDDHLRVVLRATVAQRPIVLLPTSTYGWRDIGVTVAGGGIREAYLARLRYDWRRDRYPGNPTLAPRSLVEPGEGEVLIGR